MLAKGTLVHLVDPEGDHQAMHNKHGVLWVVDSLISRTQRMHLDGEPSLYRCKSLATGYMFNWYHTEFEVRDEKASR